MARPHSAHARLNAGVGGAVASPRHHMVFKSEQGPPPRRAAGAVAVSQPLWSSAFLEPSESSIHRSANDAAASRVDDSRPATAVSCDFTANMKPVQLRRPLKCGDAVRLVMRPGGPKRPLHGWGPREVPPHPSSHGIVRKILRGNECLAHFQMENTTLRLQYSEIRMLWERWDGNTPIMKWTTVPMADGAGAEVSLSRPMSAPSARSNAESTRVAPSQLRPASAHATTPTANTIYRERRPKPGANAVRNVSHLVHSSYNQQVLKAGESSLRYANAERIRRLAQPPGADERQKHELALLKLREKEERRALRRVENRLHKRPGRTVTRRAPRPPSAPNMPVSKYRRERERAGRARGTVPIAGGDAAALSIQSAFRRHLARRELKAKKQQNTEEKEWDELEKEAAERASAVAHAAGRSRVGFAATGKRPASASARVGGGQDRIKLAAQIFAGEDEGASRRPMSAQSHRANAAGSSRTTSASEQTIATGSNGAAMDIYRARPTQKKFSGTTAIEPTRAPGMGTKRQDEKTKAAREKRAAEKAAKEAEKERLAEEAARRAEARQRAWRKQEQLRFKSAEARMRSEYQQDTRSESEERADTETEAARMGTASRLQRKAQGEDADAADVALKDLAQPNQRDNQMITESDGSKLVEQERKFATDKLSSGSTGKHSSKTKLSGMASISAPEQPTAHQARQQILMPAPEPEPEREAELSHRTEVGSKVSSTRPMAASKRQKPWEKKHKKAGNSTPPSSATAGDKAPVTETEKNTDSSVGATVQEGTGLEDDPPSATGANGLETETEEERKKRLRDEDRAARKAKREARLNTQTSASRPGPAPEPDSEVQEPEPEPEPELEPEPEPEPEPERVTETETEEERKKRLREEDKAARKAKREAKLKEQQSAAATHAQPEPEPEVQESEQVAATEEERKKRLREADKAARKAKREAKLKEQQSAAGALETVGTGAAAAQGDFEDDLADAVAGMLSNSSSAAALSIGPESADDSIFAGLSDPDTAVQFSDDEF